MSIKQIDESQLSAWVETLIAKHWLFGIQARGARFAFAPLTKAADLRLDYDVSMLPPKKLFQPLLETILKFTKGDSSYEPVTEDEQFVLFGVHPYDVVAIGQMDEIFSADTPDIHYQTRRANATLVACDIQTASDNIFASCMGTATVQEGFDILLTKVGDKYVVDSRTEKGEALMADLNGAEEASEILLARREQLWEDAQRLYVRHKLNVIPQDLPKLMGDGSYEHPVWDERAALCFSCGSCTLVCPTCYCFDIADKVSWDMNSGERQRMWDSCQLRGFAEVAGGHNFRKQREERFRHRFYRKAKHLFDRMGHIACVGCGRCITACPAKIANPVEVYNTLAEDK
jgi:ferredoxin